MVYPLIILALLVIGFIVLFNYLRLLREMKKITRTTIEVRMAILMPAIDFIPTTNL